MNSSHFLRGLLAAVVLGAAGVTSAPALAADYTAGTVKISSPWTRATPPAAKVAGGFMTLTNTGAVPDRLIGGSSPIAGRIEVHEMTLDGGIMKMRELDKGLEIKPGQKVELKPGSYHVMFMELKEPTKEGQTIKGTLVFEKAGKVDIEYKVEALGAKAQGHGGHSGHQGK